MITAGEKFFKLDTVDTSYIFKISDWGHPVHIYYGSKLPTADIDALEIKNNITLGSTVEYTKDTPNYSLDSVLLEYSGNGKGDYRHSPTELIMPDGSFVTDFVYDSHTISDEAYSNDCGLPFANGKAQTLSVKFVDKKYTDIQLVINYTVFEECNVIARNTQLVNNNDGDVFIRKFMSFMLDFPQADYNLLTLDGGWAKEAHVHEREVSYGIHITDSTVGASSNRHNPAFMLKKCGTDEEQGEAYAFNLIYSGNHYSAVEKSNMDTLRVMSGINPHCFLWKLKKGESFVTPQAVFSYSKNGTNALSQNMHRFVNEHIIRPEFQYSERPVVVNNWEATFFNFNRRKLLALARKAKMLGVEMFVLDDGWFGARNSDKAGLGDWTVNTRKLPGGIKAINKKINDMGMKFGLWFEPECVNADSNLYRTHPDWAITVPGRENSIGRNQMVLDLTRKEVRDYLVDAVDKVLCESNIEYVKWDYNRHISDMFSSSLKNQGEFFHRYILGIYDVQRRLFCEKHPNILLENCSSGGNRFDLGMLCFSPQIWTSDDTDAAERMKIQGGMYCFYPPSCISNHVSMTPNQQTLRDVALSTRFNVATFGVLGYELDFGELTPNERKQIKDQIAFYKQHRSLFQYGTFCRYSPRKDERLSWQMTEGDTTMVAIYNTKYYTTPPRDTLRILSAQEGRRYNIKSRKQSLKISRFGSLIKHVSPVALNSDGAVMRFVNRHFAMTDGQESYNCSGETLRSGINLVMQYSGTGYNPTVRILGDWGSTLYIVTEDVNKEEI